MKPVFEAILKFVGRVIFAIICEYPGALIVWVITGRKRSYSEVLNHGNLMLNSFVGLLVIAGMVNIIAYLWRHLAH